MRLACAPPSASRPPPPLRRGGEGFLPRGPDDRQEVRGLQRSAADWLDAAKYPTMSFRSHHVTITAPGHALVEGELTLHGVTRPVTLETRLMGSGPNPMSKVATVGFDVTGHIKRSDFGVTKYVPLVSDDVELMISGAFERQPG